MTFRDLTDSQRSALMARIRKTNTKPELAVRRLLHGLGYRYRLHRRDLPGTPDIVFPSRGKVILVHGCFWHRHECPAGRKQPARNTSYWIPKLRRNRERDEQAKRRLEAMGWESLVVWECETRDLQALSDQLARYLAP